MTKKLMFAVSSNLLRACYIMASNEANRAYLRGVQIKAGPEGQGAILEATNGHVAVRAIDRHAVIEAGPTLVRLRNNKSADLTPFKRLRAEATLCAYFDEADRLSTSAEILHSLNPSELTDGYAEGAVFIEELDGEFPDLSRVTPSDEIYQTDRVTQSFGTPVLKKLVEFSEALEHLCKTKLTGITVHTSEKEHAPALIRFGATNSRFDAVAVAMPVRAQSKDFAPVDWL